MLTPSAEEVAAAAYGDSDDCTAAMGHWLHLRDEDHGTIYAEHTYAELQDFGLEQLPTPVHQHSTHHGDAN
jgi:hypothetical protein